MARCPFAVWKPISGSSGRHLGGPFKIVHHTTEGHSADDAMAVYAAKRVDPHFTVDAKTIYQHVDTGESARALVNLSGGVQTNRDAAIQIELVGFAHRPKDPVALTQVARLCRWIESTHDVPRQWPSGPPKPARNGRDPGGHRRDPEVWDSQGGHYGHCHVPENSHWDPGYSAAESAFVLEAAFDAEGRLLTRSGTVRRARSARPSPALSPRIRSTMPDHHDVEPDPSTTGSAAAAPRRAGGRTADRTAASGAARRQGDAGPGDGPSLQQALRRPRICFERIVPDSLDAEQHVRRVLRAQMMAAGAGRAGGRGLDASEVSARARMAVVVSKRWDTGQTLRCRFLDGSPKMQNKVRKHAREWEQHANVRIRFVRDDPAEIRISFFADEGSWSAVGRDALNAGYFPLHQPTMNFGWVRDRSDPDEDRAVVLHEFGHALGCIHEHQTPTFKRRWNHEAVMAYFQGPPNYWSPADIEHNVLSKYRAGGIKATAYDPASIMLYTFDAQLFADGKGATNENQSLSPMDQQMIGRLYPSR